MSFTPIPSIPFEKVDQRGFNLIQVFGADIDSVLLTEEEKEGLVDIDREKYWRVPLYALVNIIQENIDKKPGQKLFAVLRFNAKKRSTYWSHSHDIIIQSDIEDDSTFWHMDTADLEKWAKEQTDTKVRDLFGKVDDPEIRAKREAFEKAKQEYEESLRIYYSN